MNVVILEGRLVGLPQEKTLESGSRILTLQLTIDRRDGDARAESVPVAWFEPKMGWLDFEEEQRLVVVGRVVRRFFHSGGRLQSRTEVVAERVIPSTRRASVRTALASVIERVAAGLEPDSTPKAGRR
jgi:hypothetical protein